MEDSGPPVSACRGRHQTTIKWLLLKTVVVSVNGKWGAMSLIEPIVGISATPDCSFEAESHRLVTYAALARCRL